jgi:hypothetical protein
MPFHPPYCPLWRVLGRAVPLAVAQVFRRLLNGRTVRGLRLERERLVAM